MNINDKIYDRIVDHMTDVRLYEEGVQVQNRKIFRRHRKNLKTLLSGDIRVGLNKEMSKFGRELLSHNVNSIKEFSTSQLDFHSDNIYKEVRGFYDLKKPKAKELVAEITGSNMKGNKTLNGNIKAIAASELVRIQSRVKAGLAAGDPKNIIVRDVLRSTKLSENQARTLARTAITSTQTAAVKQVVNNNKDIIKGYMFTAILDARTSPICSHHNGKIYAIDDKRFEPPLHWNCRSSLVPVLKSKEDLLKSKSSRVKINEVNKKTNLTGTLPKRESFSQWLSRQSSSVQEKILGTSEKVNLFRQGGLAVSQFTNIAGRAISIAALRRKAAQATSLFPTRQINKDIPLTVGAARPNSLLNNPKHREDLLRLFISDSSDVSQSISLTDFKGVSLTGKQASRRRTSNQFDERNFSTDPMTGEIKNNLIYDPNFRLYQERIDFMRNSKLLTSEQKNFIENVANSLEDKISVNQQSVVIENLRVVLERYSKDKQPWSDFASVVRAENRFAVQNISRLLDTRSRSDAQLFARYITSKEGTPQVQIMGRYYTVKELQKNMLADQRFIDNWRGTVGTKLARRLYLTGRVPFRLYFRRIFTQWPSRISLVKTLRKRYPLMAKAYDRFVLDKKKVPTDSWITKEIAKGRETIRRIIDLEFARSRIKPQSAIVDQKSLESITKSLKLVASGQSTDYDALAVNIGKKFAEDFATILPWTSHSLSDYHRVGSDILNFLVQRKLIKVNLRGKIRRSPIDLDTGRPTVGAYKETLSREVVIIDKNLLKLQEAERRVTIAQRVGIVNNRDKLYVKAGNLDFFDARGNKTGISVISSSRRSTFEPSQMDRDMVKMLTHAMNVKYKIDNEFASFMEDVVRFRDNRGRAKYYDEINGFRKEILVRGEDGYGMMSTIRYHRLNNQPFSNRAIIDSRGRVYYQGYLTPTKGEIARPFLNSSVARNITPEVIEELKIQTGAMIGPGTEALTQNGRLAIFKRNESEILKLGNLMLAQSQRDRRIREFLEHPLVKNIKAKEVPKIARLALEYARIHRHVDGNLENIKLLKKYKTSLTIENDASSSGAQIIGLSTGDRKISLSSNILPTNQKNRLYDLVAMDTINDPEFLKISSLRNSGLIWEDIADAAKAQNMVSFYGAGVATRSASVAKKLQPVLEDKGYLVVTKDTLNPNLRLVDEKIKLAKRAGANTTVKELTSFRKELVELINKNEPVGRTLIKEAFEIHNDVGDFVNQLTNVKRGIISPKDFARLSEIMTKNLSQRAPVTNKFIQFWKKAAKSYVSETESVDLPWVTFDNKLFLQKYRPKLQERIEFRDPISGRRIANIYETEPLDGALRGKASVNRAGISFGVNGNHSNDASIVRQFHLWGRRTKTDTATIHDAFFTNIAVANRAKTALRTIYANALESRTIEKTLREMRRRGLSRRTYNELLEDAKRQGLINPENKVTRKEILAPIKQGQDWYGIGP